MNLDTYLEKLKNKRITVIGAGISNKPLIDLLLNAGIHVTVCDKRTRQLLDNDILQFESLGANLTLGEHYLDNLSADIIFRTPGLMPHHPAIQSAVNNGASLTSEMETFFDICPCPIIAVTGSDGKTTTTSIIADLLSNQGFTAHVGGNIGTPLLPIANEILPNHFAVIELSSFQLITMNKSPHIAVVTNASPNHLDTHRNMDEYINAKRNIFIHQSPDDRAVFNLDNPFTRQFADSANGKTLFFSRQQKPLNGVFLDGDTIYETTNGSPDPIVDVRDILLPGLHNIENFMAAFCAVRNLVGRDTMRQTARSFSGVPHRIELVRTLHGVRFYNDSIASSPSRTIAGLRSFSQKVILIAGGKDKGVPFDDLAPEIIAHVKSLVLTGLTADKIRETVINSPAYNGDPEILIVPDFADAVLAASKIAAPGDTVLLSPACTSFDKFKNFEERGDFFKNIVKELR